MSRTGVEEKPPWRIVPAEVRSAVEAALGSPVSRAMRIWGGYGPTPTFRLRLRDGRRAFLKGVGPDGNEFMKRAIQREARVYRELAPQIRPWAPACFGDLTVGDWRLLLLEDLGPKSAPPWTRALARRVLHAYADFHNATDGTALPEWLGPPSWRSWPGPIDVPDAALRRWLADAEPALAAAALVRGRGRRVLLHNDTRSDNLRWVRGRLYLLDWPHAGAGDPEEDLVAFVQSVTAEGGPEPDQLVAWYAERRTVNPVILNAVIVSVAGYFVSQAYLPDPVGLPRLRPFQRAQLAATLEWAAQHLGLPKPPPQ